MIANRLKKNMRLPAIAAPLFIISNPRLVIEQCKAGIIGSFPALNARPASLLGEWLEQINTELAEYQAANPDKKVAPYAVNLIAHKTNPRLEEDLAVCVEHKVPMVITSLGARRDLNDAIHSYGGVVFHDVINQKFVRKAVEKGADGLILVAAGAGGHAGRLSPFAFVQETRAWFDGPIAMSGCIAHGRSILGAVAMGADFAYIGSPFIATEEANAVEPQKQMICDSNAEDIVYSNNFTGVWGNYLKPSIRAAGLDPDRLHELSAGPMDLGDGTIKAKAWKNIWGAGQGIGAVTKVQSTKDLVDQFYDEYRAASEALSAQEI